MKSFKLVKKRYLFLLFIGVILAFGMSSMPISSAASTVSVNTTGNDSNNGTAANPYLTISTGISKVDNKGTVNLSKGTFNLNNGAGKTDYGITINKNLTIQGAGSTQTIIDAKGLNYVFTIKNSNVIIKDLTIENGYSQSGGAITNSFGSNLTLINCVLTNNTAATTGGAIYNSGYLNATSNTFFDNTVIKGYGYDIYNNGSADVHFNSIIGNNESSMYSAKGTINAQNNWWGTNSNPGTELENFGDINNWTPMWGATTKTVTINGDTGIQVSGANGTYPGMVKSVNYNFNGVAPQLQLWVYIDSGDGGFQLPSNLLEIGFNLLTNDPNKYFSTFLLESQLQKGLNYIVIPLINATGGNTWTSNGGITWNDTITGVQLRLFYNPGVAANVTFLELKKNVPGIPKMVLTFDDGYTSIFNTAFPIMQKYGITGTIYLNEGFVGLPGYLTLAQLHTLYNAGWSIANHTPVHTNLSLLTSVAAIKETVQGGIDWLLANGFTRGAYDLALPWGVYNDMVLQALTECDIQTDRTVMLRNTATPPDSLLQITQEGPEGMNYPDGPNYTTLALAEDFVTNTIESQTSTFVMMHQILDVPQTGSDWATADFANWIAYIGQEVAQNKIEMDSVDEWYTDLVNENLTSEGTVNYSPWIIMNATSSTNPLISGTSNITADFTHNSDGQDVSAQGHIPDGIVTNFSSDSLGTVNPTSAETVNGKASTIYTAGPNRGISTVNIASNNQSLNLTVKITDPSIYLSVTGSDPTNGAVKVPGNKSIIITFNEPIQADSAYNNIVVTNTNNLNDTTTKPITTSISGDTLTITPTYNWLSLATYQVTIPYNSISDLLGSNLASNYTMNFTSYTDTTPPTINSIDPANNTNVTANKVISVTFSEPVQAGNSYDNISIIDTNTSLAQTINKNISSNILTITSPDNWTIGDTYSIIIPANSVTDLSGNNLATDYKTSFTCDSVADTVPPTIVSTDPANNATNVSTSQVMTITFSEPILAGSEYNNIVVMNTNDVNDTSAKPITTNISGNTLTITPTYDWLQQATYMLTIPQNSITDLSGNNLAADYITSFTIG